MRKLAATILVCFMIVFTLGCKEEFSIRTVSPASGALGGGEPVEIIGSGFNPNQGVAIYFGNAKASNVAISSTTKLTVSTPSVSEPQVVDIRIATDDGKELLLKRAFRYVEKGSMDMGFGNKKKHEREH